MTSMSLSCSASADSLTSVLLAGDAILNLSPQPLNVAAGTAFVSDAGGRLLISDRPTQLHWRPTLTGSLAGLISDAVARLVVVSEPDCAEAGAVLQALQTQQVPHCHCVLSDDCDAAAFMDEEDAEAVAERLRQLGYI